MLIDSDNFPQGNRAMASVLLLYYHLIREGGFTNDQMVYVDRQEFDVFAYVDVTVSPDQQFEIDQPLLRQGAAVGLLCELNDMVSDYAQDYLAQPFTQRVLAALARVDAHDMPEVPAIVEAVTRGEAVLDPAGLQGMLRGVFETYVVAAFARLASGAR